MHFYSLLNITGIFPAANISLKSEDLAGFFFFFNKSVNEKHGLSEWMYGIQLSDWRQSSCGKFVQVFRAMQQDKKKKPVASARGNLTPARSSPPIWIFIMNVGPSLSTQPKCGPALGAPHEPFAVGNKYSQLKTMISVWQLACRQQNS